MTTLAEIQQILENTQTDGENASSLWQDPVGTVTLRNGDTVDNLRKRLRDVGIWRLFPGGPVDVATTADITLSGEQTIDGVTTSASRVLVKDQTDSSENGIYVSTSGAWTRATGANEPDEFFGHGIYVNGGNQLGKFYYVDTDVIAVGTSPITFELAIDFGAELADAVVRAETAALGAASSEANAVTSAANAASDRASVAALAASTPTDYVVATYATLPASPSTNEVALILADENAGGLVTFRVFDGAVWGDPTYLDPDFTDVSDMLAAPGTFPEGTFLRAAGYLYEVVSPSATDHHLIATGGKLKIANYDNVSRDMLDQSTAYTFPAGVVADCYNAGGKMILKDGDVAALECDPTSGDDLQSMVYWVAGHRVPQGSEMYVEVQDGLHDVSTIIQMTDNRNVLIKGASLPDHIDISGATFALDSGDVYDVTVTVAEALPARVVAGFALGGQNVQGDGAAGALNTAFLVESVAGDRLSFTAKIQVDGVAPVAFTTPDNTASLGLTPNQLVIPNATIRAAEAGWDGAAQDEEGFITCLSGGRVDLQNIGLSYNGVAGDNDMIFARDTGSEVYLRDHVVIAGTGAMVSRSYGHGNIMAYGSFLGGGAFGTRTWQGSGGGTGNFTRTMLGSVSAEILSGSSGAYAWAGNCILSGGNYGARTTYPNANIELASSRVHQCNIGVGGSRGAVYIDGNSEISRCTTPISLSGGVVEGDPDLISNTNAAPEHNVYDGQGGYWRKDFAPINGNLNNVGIEIEVNDFGAIPANSILQYTFTPSIAVEANDFVLIKKNSSALPVQNVSYSAEPDGSTGDITITARNHTDSSINPTAITFYMTILRVL